jgi:hypothetical protein
MKFWKEFGLILIFMVFLGTFLGGLFVFFSSIDRGPWSELICDKVCYPARYRIECSSRQEKYSCSIDCYCAVSKGWEKQSDDKISNP